MYPGPSGEPQSRVKEHPDIKLHTQPQADLRDSLHALSLQNTFRKGHTVEDREAQAWKDGCEGRITAHTVSSCSVKKTQNQCVFPHWASVEHVNTHNIPSFCKLSSWLIWQHSSHSFASVISFFFDYCSFGSVWTMCACLKSPCKAFWGTTHSRNAGPYENTNICLHCTEPKQCRFSRWKQTSGCTKQKGYGTAESSRLYAHK